MTKKDFVSLVMKSIEELSGTCKVLNPYAFEIGHKEDPHIGLQEDVEVEVEDGSILKKRRFKSHDVLQVEARGDNSVDELKVYRRRGLCDSQDKCDVLGISEDHSRCSAVRQYDFHFLSFPWTLELSDPLSSLSPPRFIPSPLLLIITFK